MLDTVSRVKRRSLRGCLFVTLTYPAVYSSDPQAWHDDLRAWWARVVRRFPNASCVWRLEAQERGAPHFHLLIFGVRFMAYGWIGQSWAECVARGGIVDAAHAESGTSIERVRSIRGAWSYVSKYCAKAGGAAFAEWDTGEVIEQVGRHWGVMGRARVPWSGVRIYCVPEFACRQGLLGYLHARTGHRPVFDASTVRYYGMIDASSCIVGKGRGFEVVECGPSEWAGVTDKALPAEWARRDGWRLIACG